MVFLYPSKNSDISKNSNPMIKITLLNLQPLIFFYLDKRGQEHICMFSLWYAIWKTHRFTTYGGTFAICFDKHCMSSCFVTESCSVQWNLTIMVENWKVVKKQDGNNEISTEGIINLLYIIKGFLTLRILYGFLHKWYWHVIYWVIQVFIDFFQ